MTPEFLLEVPVWEEIEQTARAREPEPTRETVAGGARITRDASAGQVLVAVVGLGYAGLPSAVALRRAGFRIVGIDTSTSRLSSIRGAQAGRFGTNPQDPGGLRDEDFVLTNEIEAVQAADVVLICVPSSLDAQRRPNPDGLTRACTAVVENARAGQTLVLTSTGYIGSTRELLVEPLEERGLRVGEDVFVAFSPERIDPGVPEHEQPRTPASSVPRPIPASGTLPSCCATSPPACTASPLRRWQR